MGAMAKKLKCAPGPVEEESKFQQLGEFKNELLRLLAENLGIEYWDNVLLVCKRWRIVFSPCAESFNIVTNPRASVSLIGTFPCTYLVRLPHSASLTFGTIFSLVH